MVCGTSDAWTQFIELAKNRCGEATFGNWLSPIRVLESSEESITLEVPNIFVKDHLLTHYRQDLQALLPVKANGELAIHFVVATKEKKLAPLKTPQAPKENKENDELYVYENKLNDNYRFENFIEGPSNQFVKSAAMGVAARPGKSYNPLFIHGGVGLGKTHLLHSIAHFVKEHHRNRPVQYITTEEFINNLVDSLRTKSIDRLKRYYRTHLDVLIIDDIQFLQNRTNFEEEFCNMFEALIHQKKQVVISSDKPPSQLQLSERMIARMESGLVAHIGVPDLETRVAILQQKAELKGLEIPSQVAFFIAEHIFNNVRQLEGAVNRLSAHCRLLDLKITEEVVEETLREMLQHPAKKGITVEEVLKSVAQVFQVRVSDIKSSSRTKEIALSRQVAMYLAYKLINESLQMLGASFGKTHSTILHACKAIEKKVKTDDALRRQIGLVERSIQETG